MGVNFHFEPEITKHAISNPNGVTDIAKGCPAHQYANTRLAVHGGLPDRKGQQAKPSCGCRLDDHGYAHVGGLNGMAIGLGACLPTDSV